MLAQSVPWPVEVLIASDGSRDDTVAVAGRLASTDPRVRVLDLPRGGQAMAQSAVFAAARGAVVVLTDVETRFTPGCLAALVAPFSAAQVGCTTGILKWHFDIHSSTARHESLYWRYEQAVRAWESRAGWLAAGTGALLAVRRTLFGPVPAHASLDQMLPLYAREQGLLVIVAPDAIGSDRGTADTAEQLAARTRIATQGIETNLRMLPRIAPWRRPGTFLAMLSHKLLRWLTPYLAALAVLAGVALWSAGETAAYLLPLAAACLAAGLAGLGALSLRRGRPLPGTGFPLTLVAVNLAFALAWLNVVLRRRVSAWESVPN